MSGNAIPIPQLGEAFNGAGLYVARCRVGYGDTAGSAGGASDGLDVWTDTQEVLNLFEINSSGVLVHQVQHVIPTAFTASVTLTIGPSSDPDGFAAAAQTAATVARYSVPGGDTLANPEGFLFASTDAITGTFGGADVATGIAEVYVVYSYAPNFAQNDTGGSSNS